MNLSALRLRARSVRRSSPRTPPPHVVEEFERAQETISQQIADGTLGDDALDREELAEKFNTLLGRDEFTA